MCKNHHYAFTLVELLTVVAIMGLIFAIGIPAFHNLTKSAGLSAGARQLVGTLNLARQYAITHREHTFVVFPYTNSTPASMSNKVYVSYSVISSNRTTGLGFVSKWERLPNGVVFIANNTFPKGKYYPDYCLQTGPFTVSGTNYSNIAYIEFRPTGAATPPKTGSLNAITLSEGFMENKMSTRTSSNYVDVIVEPLTGRIRTERD